MRRSALILPALILLATGSLALGGCVASMAVSAASALASAAAGSGRDRVVTEDRREAATAACRARAAQIGNVHIIDVEQRSNGVVTVWGTIQDAQQRRSFECTAERAITGFKLREIRPRQ